MIRDGVKEEVIYWNQRFVYGKGSMWQLYQPAAWKPIDA